MLAEIDDFDSVGERMLDNRLGGARNENLAAPARTCDSCRAVDVDADVVVATKDSSSGVNAHANPNVRIVRPPVGLEASLAFDCRLYCGRGGLERCEEGVAFGSDDDAARAVNGPAQDLVVLGELVCERVVAKVLEKARRPLDVCEQERDRP